MSKIHQDIRMRLQILAVKIQELQSELSIKKDYARRSFGAELMPEVEIIANEKIKALKDHRDYILKNKDKMGVCHPESCLENCEAPCCLYIDVENLPLSSNRKTCIFYKKWK
jgi:hypothetical protein